MYSWTYGAYFTDCEATAPSVYITLDGIEFIINPADLINRELKDPETGSCMTGIASGGTGPFILGDTFMQNVVSVFDVGGARMHFIPRPFY